MNTMRSATPQEGSVSDQHEVLRKVLLDRRRDHIETLETIDAEITQLQAELSRRIEDARIRRQPIDEALNHLEALLQIEGWSEGEEGKVHYAQGPGGNGKIPIETAYDLLSTVGKPLHYRELAQEISKSGVYLAGKDPAATLLSKMSRDARFRRAPERGNYGLASWRMRKSPTGKRKAKRSKKPLT